MKNLIKATTAAVIVSLTIGTTALANERGHEAELDWMDDMTAAQNYEAAAKSVDEYCRIEASRLNQRNQSFKRKFRANCAAQLMDSYVNQVDSKALSIYHAMTKNPVTKTTQLAAKR